MTDIATRRPSALPIITAVTSLGFVLVQLDVSIVNVALAKIGDTLHAGVGELQWVVDAYSLAFASLLLPAGTLGDRFGARKIFIIGLAIFTAASLACALAPSAGVLILGRAVQGVGAALAMPCSLAVLNHACRGDKATRSRAIGLWTAAGAGAISAGVVLGGLIVQRLGWPNIFLVNVPLGLIGIAAAFRFLDETDVQRGSHRFDWQGQALAALTLFALTFAVIEAGSSGWAAALPIIAMAVAVAAAVAFAATEAMSAEPILPLSLFGNRAFGATMFAGFSVNLAIYGAIFVLSFYFQKARGYSPAETGLAFLPFMGFVVAANVWGGRVSAEHGPRLPMMLGLALGALGFALVADADGGTSYAALIWRLLLIPAGIGLAVPPMTTAFLSCVPTSRSGMASGVLNTVRQAAGAIGVALFGSLISGGIVGGMHVAFIACAVLLAIAACIAAIGLRAD